MSHELNPESIDLAALTLTLREVCGPSVAGTVMGRTRLRDEVTRHLGCSLLMGETIVDTMIGRGFIRKHVHIDGWVDWLL